MHSVSPEVAAMRPFAHAVHCEAPGALTVPGAQLAHGDWPEVLVNVPAEQNVHIADPTDDVEPGN